MTQEQISKYEAAHKDKSVPDEENPLFLFSKTSTNLLVRILNKEFNIYALVRMNLQERGVNDKGQWVGFKKLLSRNSPRKKEE